MYNRLKKFIAGCRGRQKYRNDVKKYNSMSQTQFVIKKEYKYPVYSDGSDNAGKLDVHYFLQDIWMAARVLENHPENHYDIGSRIDGFIAHLLSNGMDINMIDIRPLPYEIEHLHFVCADATNLEKIKSESISSLSSLHAVEHFGLGRYGDPVDPQSCFHAMHAFQRVLMKDGILYFSVPVGAEDRLYFNAHRVFSPYTIIHEFSELSLTRFAYIKDFVIHEVDLQNTDQKVLLSEIGDYSCGMFVFKKVGD